MRVMMVLASAGSYLVNNAIAKGALRRRRTKMNFEAPLTMLVWLTSIVSVVLTYVLSYLLIPDARRRPTLWWKLSTVITCGTLAGAIIPELVKVFTSTQSAHVQGSGHLVARGRRVAQHPVRPGGGNFSAYWLGMAIMGLMAVAYWRVACWVLGRR